MDRAWRSFTDLQAPCCTVPYQAAPPDTPGLCWSSYPETNTAPGCQHQHCEATAGYRITFFTVVDFSPRN